MSIEIVKKQCAVYHRAGIPVFVVGPHGIGKTSSIAQLYAELARDKGRSPLPNEVVVQKLVDSRVSDDVSISVDVTSLSTLDSRHVMREDLDPEAFGFWSVSAPNLSIEELIGMPHIDDRGAIFREAYYRSQDAAATMLARGYDADSDFGGMDEALEALTLRVFDRNCKFLGITERDRNDLVLRYLRMNSLLPSPDHKGGGILLFDELNRSFQEVKTALMQLLLEGIYLDYRLPPDVWMVTTMNPPGGAYQVRELDIALLDRGAVIGVAPDKDSWLDWAKNRGLGEHSRVFVDKNSKLVNKAAADLDIDAITNPATFRSIEQCDRAFAVMTDDEMKDVGPLIAKGLLGPEAGMLYYKEATDTLHRPVPAAKILKDYGWSPDMDREKVEDFRSWPMTKTRSRIKSMTNRTNVKSELLNITLGEIKDWADALDADLEKRGGTKHNVVHTDEEKGQCYNVMLFLVDLPMDIARKFVMDDMRRTFWRVLYFMGKMPVAKELHKRVSSDYEKAGEQDGVEVKKHG